MNEDKALEILFNNKVRISKRMIYFDLDDLKNIKGDLKSAIDYLHKDCSYPISDTKVTLATYDPK